MGNTFTKTRVPNEKLEQFRRLVIGNVALQQQLRDVEDRTAFQRRVVELGATYGYHFTVEDVEHAMQTSRRAWLAQKIVR